MHRFFAPALSPGDESVLLPRDEAEHLTRVLRLGPGESIAIFDGRGQEFLARVSSIERRDVRVQILARREPAPEPLVPLTLVQAVLKGDKMDDVVRDATMLGAAAIQPIVTTRTEVTVAALSRGGRVDRWRRVALASAKQSRRAVVPDVLQPLTFDNWLGEPKASEVLMLVEPSQDLDATAISSLRNVATPVDVAVAVGPEGGWEEGECAHAREHGVRLVRLGGRTLRADAVPIVAISVLQLMWGDF